MKADKIYVGGRLSMANGAIAVAVYPAPKGEKDNYLLTDAGKLLRMAGTRINGVGVPRFLESEGFTLAKPGDAQAEKLATLLDAKEGLKLFEAATREQAHNNQSWLGSKTMKVVPYQPEKEPYNIFIEAPDGSSRVAADLSAGISVGAVNIAYRSGSSFTHTVLQGWLLGENEPVSDENAPRLTEYGGVVEHACYLLCAAFMAVLEGAKHLEDNIEEVKDVPFPRGFLRLRLTDASLTTSDYLVVGIDALDQLCVVYERDGQELYQRKTMTEPRLSDVVGDIMAAVVRVREMDAKVSKSKTRRRA